METAEAVEKPYQTPRPIKFMDGILDTIIVAAIMFMLLFSAFAMWDTENMHSNAMSDQYAIYNPAENPLSFAELRAINPDVFGWITVFGTLIDYPLVQGENNSFYLNHNVHREFSLAGAIFLDAENDRNFTDFNSIIHGHHMDQGAMFGNIDLFTDYEFFDSRRYGNLMFNDSDHGLEFFAFIETSGYNWQIFNPAIEGVENQQAYIDLIYEIATHTRDVGVTTDDNIVLLATCTNEFTNGRHLLAAKLHDDPFPNPFGDAEAEARERQNFIDGDLLPFLRRFCLPALIIAAILVTAYWSIERRKRWNVEDKWAEIQADPELKAHFDKVVPVKSKGKTGSSAKASPAASLAKANMITSQAAKANQATSQAGTASLSKAGPASSGPAATANLANLAGSAGPASSPAAFSTARPPTSSINPPTRGGIR